MAGNEYLEAIKKELQAGRHQHRMGENVLAAFGYVRRRQAALDDINASLKALRLRTVPAIDQVMPLQSPRIRFYLQTDEVLNGPAQAEEQAEESADEDEDVEPWELNPALLARFRIAELDAAERPVLCISQDAPLAEAYTVMALHKYSQLVVANGDQPRGQDIKGIVSYQSIAKALLNGGSKPPKTVRECIDTTVPKLHSDADLKDVVPLLAACDVILVLGQDNRLKGIVTAWDLAEEFADLVNPFKRIGEVEARLRALLQAKLGQESIRAFLTAHPAGNGERDDSPDELTISDLQMIIEHPTIGRC